MVHAHLSISRSSKKKNIYIQPCVEKLFLFVIKYGKDTFKTTIMLSATPNDEYSVQIQSGTEVAVDLKTVT